MCDVKGVKCECVENVGLSVHVNQLLLWRGSAGPDPLKMPKLDRQHKKKNNIK